MCQLIPFCFPKSYRCYLFSRSLFPRQPLSTL
nr:MAG TPA: hypothetical protein [Caudoviricetes sp.]